MAGDALTQRRVFIIHFNRSNPASGLLVELQAPVPAVERGHVLVKLLWRPITHFDLLTWIEALSTCCYADQNIGYVMPVQQLILSLSAFPPARGA